MLMYLDCLRVEGVKSSLASGNADWGKARRGAFRGVSASLPRRVKSVERDLKRKRSFQPWHVNSVYHTLRFCRENYLMDCSGSLTGSWHRSCIATP